MAYFEDDASRRLEILYASEDAARRRRFVLEALQLAPGERVIDIGIGSGFLAHDMAERVGETGEVIGIDISEPMMERARRRCADQPWVRLEAGEATRLPLPDSGLDVAVSVQVYEYVPDIESALAEMYRVLRPGGRAAIVATDWTSTVWNASDENRMQRVLSAYAEHCVHRDLPRILGPKLRHAGFSIAGQDVVPQFNPAYDQNTYSYYLISRIRGFAPGRNGLSEQEVENWAGDLQQLGENGKYFFCVNQYLFVVTKPAG